MSGRPRDEAGLATIWTLVLAGVLSALVGASGLVLGVGTVRARAAAAADLAALAAAGTLPAMGADAACRRAAEVAAANGARLESCVPAGAVVAIDVSVPLPRLLSTLAGAERVTRRARAGPVAPGSA